MRRSSRIACFLGLSGLVVSAAQAGGTRASGIGLARSLSPIHPIVGASRGLSPVTIDARGGVRSPRRRVAPDYGGYGYGYDLAEGGLPGFTGVPAGVGPVVEGGEGPGPYRVIVAPPPPCVSPQIIRIGKSARGARAEPPHVRVVYGVPGCGRF